MGLRRKQNLNPVEVLSCVLAVDGAGSKIDADTVDGKHAAELLTEAGQAFQNQTSYLPTTNKIPMYDINRNIKSNMPLNASDVVNKAYFEAHRNDGISFQGYATEAYVANAIQNAGHLTSVEVAEMVQTAVLNNGGMPAADVNAAINTAIAAAIGQAVGGSY